MLATKARILAKSGVKVADFLLSTEPIWVTIATLFIYFAVLTNSMPSFRWLALAVVLLPFPLKLWRQRSSLHTPFNIPILLFLAGAVVGLVVSKDFRLSLGAFQSCLAMTSIYFMLVNHAGHERGMKIAIVLWAIPVIAVAILTLRFWGEASSSISMSTFSDPLTYPPHTNGLAFAFLIIALLLLGIAMFEKRIYLRIIGGSSCVALLCAMVFMAQDSLKRLFSGVSIQGRLPLWEASLHMIQQHPLSGIGLGCWPLVYHPGMISHPGHPHEAYLELFSNTGVLGIIAAIFALVVVIRLALGILRMNGKGFWHGFGVGVVLVIIAAAILGFVESSPFSIMLVGKESYYYAISPLPWIFCAFLVVAYRCLRCPS